MKNLWKCFFRASRRVSFSYLSNNALYYKMGEGSSGGVPPDTYYSFSGHYNILFKPYATSKMELFMTKKGNSWELLLAVVTESFVLNMTAHRSKRHR